MAVAALLLLAAGCTVLAQSGGLDPERGAQSGSVSMSGQFLYLFAQESSALGAPWPAGQSKTQQA